MKTDMYETLNAAIEQLREKEPIPNILQDHPGRAQELLTLLQMVEALDSIAPVEMPSHATMQEDRNDFLIKATQIANSTVSPDWLTRIKGWTGILFHRPQISLSYLRKEKWNMSTILVRAALVVGLLFGATGGAYAMADNSLPNEPMYGAKLAMEQFRLNMTSDPAGIATRHMEMTQNRIQEIVHLAQKGTPPDAGTMTRLQQHLNTALQFAAQLGNDGEMLGLLTQTKAMVQEQVQAMNRIQTQGEDPLHEPLQFTLQLLYQFQNRLEAGIQDPQAFRWQYQHGQNEDLDAFGLPGGNPDCPSDDCVPAGDEHKYGQSEEDPPGQPGGNPDCPSDDCVPVGDEHKYGQSEGSLQLDGTLDYTSEDCIPEGDENKYGPQPDQPGPGQSGGNPDCPNCTCEDCVPEGDENQYGPQPDQPGPGQPDVNPDCPTDDCEPIGDQNGPNGP